MFKVFAGAVTALSIGLFSSMALADDVQGTIQAFDPEQRVITLDNGQTYILAEGVPIAGLQQGMQVKLTYNTSGDQHVVSAFEPLAAGGAGMGGEAGAGAGGAVAPAN